MPMTIRGFVMSDDEPVDSHLITINPTSDPNRSPALNRSNVVFEASEFPFEFENLTPGEEYIISVISLLNGESSNPAETRQTVGEWSLKSSQEQKNRHEAANDWLILHCIFQT